MTSFLINGQNVNIFTSPYIGENMYVMVKNNQALLVDPNGSDEALNLLNTNKVKDITIFLTHEHLDHTCGVPILQEKFQTKLICQSACAEYIMEKNNNRPLILELILRFQDEKNNTNTADMYPYPEHEYTCLTDITFNQNFVYNWQGEYFVFHHTPGHSQGSCCIIWNDTAVFTGDSCLKDIPVITRFPGGNTKKYNAITKPFLDSLPDDMTVFPGHGQIFTLKEIRVKES